MTEIVLAALAGAWLGWTIRALIASRENSDLRQQVAELWAQLVAAGINYHPRM